MDSMENWKDILGYEGLYQVSDLGRIKALKRKVPFRHFERTYPEIIMKSNKDTSGYYQVDLSKLGKRQPKLVHRTVLEAFVCECPDNMETNHIDEDKSNNTLENLEWVTKSENCLHGTRSKRFREKMLNGPNSKQLVQMDLNGNFIKTWPSLNEAGRNGFNIGNVSMCCNGIYKSSSGYTWKYAS